MQWLSSTCVIVDSEKLISANYHHYTASAGQFSLERPYQAQQQDGSPPANIHTLYVCSEEPIQQHPTEALSTRTSSQPDAEAVLECSAVQLRHKRKRRKVTADPQRQLRQHEANERHDTRQPILLSAYQLLQQHVHRKRGIMLCGRAASAPAQHLTDAVRSDVDTHDPAVTFDLLALDDLKYTLHPKLQFDNTSDASTQELALNLFDTMLSNQHEAERIATAHETQVLIPAHAAFLMSDIKKLQPLLSGTVTAIAVKAPSAPFAVSIAVLTTLCAPQHANRATIA